MKRCLLPLMLALASCGGGSPNATGNEPRGFVSLLSKLDAPALVEGIELVDATDYWTQAEARNGNAFPIKADPDAADTVVVQLLGSGELRLREGAKFRPVTLSVLSERLEDLARAHSAPGQTAASCAVLLAAHVDAPAQVLAALCHACVHARVGNLWLATRDKRDGNCRLMNLVLNPERSVEPWYGGAPDSPAPGAARLEWKEGHPSLVLAKGKRLEVPETAKWGLALGLKLAEQNPRPRRLQLALQRGTTLSAVQTALRELAGAAFAEIEPLWPLSEDVRLVDATVYWRASTVSRTEINTPDEAQHLFVRILAGGKIGAQVGAGWEDSGLEGLRKRLQPMADAARTESGNALCTVNVLADAGSQWRNLLEVCRLCVDCRVPQLRLCTEESDVFGRLLPLKVDTSQQISKGYRVADEQQLNIVLMTWTGQTPVFAFGDGKKYGVDDVKDWGKALRKLVDARDPKPRRLLLELPLDADLGRLQAVLADAAVGRFLEIEPLWATLPALATLPTPPRKYEDHAGLADRIEPPEAGGYWKAAAKSTRLPNAAVVDEKLPVLYLTCGSDGRWASRSAQGAWTAHADDEAVRLLLESAAKLEDESAHSSLQVVAGIDRRAPWKAVMALAEMMISARAATLYVLTRDESGLYLMDLTLPVAGGDIEKPLAEAWLRDKDPEGKYTVQLSVGGGEGRVFGGEGFLEALRKAAGENAVKAGRVSIIMGGAESTQMFFSIVDATAPLEPLDFVIGLPLAVPPTPEPPPPEELPPRKD